MDIFDPVITDINLLSFSGWLQKIPGLHTKSGQQCNTQQTVCWTRPEIPNLGQSGTILHQRGNNLNITLEMFIGDGICNFSFKNRSISFILGTQLSLLYVHLKTRSGNRYNYTFMNHNSYTILLFTSTYTCTFMRINCLYKHCMDGWLKF